LESVFHATCERHEFIQFFAECWFGRDRLFVLHDQAIAGVGLFSLAEQSLDFAPHEGIGTLRIQIQGDSGNNSDDKINHDYSPM
jgi:hypothetical protein